MKRDLKFDNLRGLAITLIVLNHFIGRSPLITSLEFGFIYKLIYLIDLPLLIFISGYFSKDSPESSIKAFKTIFIPYLIFNTLWILFAYFNSGTIPPAAYLIPEIGLWYLMSLYLWRVFLPTATKIRYVFAISLLLALVIGILEIDGKYLSVSRTLCYFPLFILGFYFKEIKEKLILNKYLAMGVLVPLLLVASVCLIPYSTKVVVMNYAYHCLGMGNIKGIIMRLGIICVSMISVILLCNIMTGKKTFLTKIGRNSLTVYVLQFYLIVLIPEILNYFGLKDLIMDNYHLTIIYIISATLITTFILSRDKVKEGADVLINAVTKILIKETPDELKNKGKPS